MIHLRVTIQGSTGDARPSDTIFNVGYPGAHRSRHDVILTLRGLAQAARVAAQQLRRTGSTPCVVQLDNVTIEITRSA